MEDLYALKLKALWRQFWSEHFSFWMICGYLFVEYVRPQSIIPSLDVLPWAQFFLLFSLIGVFFDKSHKRVADPANKWMVIFLLVIITSIVFAKYPEVARSHFMDFFGWFVIYFLIVNIVNTEARLLIFMLIFMLASFKISAFMAKVWALRGFAFTNWGLQGPPGFFENSGELAVQMLMFSPIAYMYAKSYKPLLGRMKYWFIMTFPLTGAMTIMGSSSRGGQIGLVYQLLKLFIKRKAAFKSFFFLALVSVAVFTLIPDEQKARFTEAGSDKTSKQRLLYWTHGLEMIENNPWLGVGFFNFRPEYEAAYSHDMLYPRAELPHNIFVQVGTDTGCIGLAVYGMLIFRALRSTASLRAKLQAAKLDQVEPIYEVSKGFDAAFIGFLIAGQFVTIGYYPFMWIHLALVVSLHNVYTYKHHLK